MTQDELRWRLAAIAVVAARRTGNQSQAVAATDEAKAALGRLRQSLANNAVPYDARRDLAYLRKLAGLT